MADNSSNNFEQARIACLRKVIEQAQANRAGTAQQQLPPQPQVHQYQAPRTQQAACFKGGPQLQQEGVQCGLGSGISQQPLPPMPPSIAAFAAMPAPEKLPPIDICESDIVVYEYIANRARATADNIEASIRKIRAAMAIRELAQKAANKDSTQNSGGPQHVIAIRELAQRAANNSTKNTREPQHVVTNPLHAKTSAPATFVPQGTDKTTPQTIDHSKRKVAWAKKSRTSVSSPRERDNAESAKVYEEMRKQQGCHIALNPSNDNEAKKATSKIPARRKSGEIEKMANVVQPAVVEPCSLVSHPSNDFVLATRRDMKDGSAAVASFENLSWAEILKDSEFVKNEDIGCASDVMLIALAQMKLCALTEDDRIGRYMQQEIGYLGLCCKHCFGQPGYGRYFPSTLPSFISSFPATVLKHVADDCYACPKDIQLLIKKVERVGQRSLPRSTIHFGSKGFMHHVWDLFRTTKAEDLPPDDVTVKTRSALALPVLEDAPMGSFSWGDMLADSALVLPEDRYLVPDVLYASFGQMEPCIADRVDCTRSARVRITHGPDFPGMCCRHCSGAKSLNGARLFPTNVLCLSLADTCTKVTNHMIYDCPAIPHQIRSLLRELNQPPKVAPTGPRRYGSRRIFFRRMWFKLHGPDCPENFDPKGSSSGDNKRKKMTEAVEAGDDLQSLLSIEALIARSPLVSMDERHMVSDAHFVAFAQLKPTRATPADRCGWYKDREPDFPGVCCMWCGGRPSSGRYFPKIGTNYLRSSKRSIIRHITENCMRCPKDVRFSLSKLQERDDQRSSWKIVDDSTLGSGKLFHERILVRLYKRLGVPYTSSLLESNEPNEGTAIPEQVAQSQLPSLVVGVDSHQGSRAQPSQNALLANLIQLSRSMAPAMKRQRNN